MTVILLLVAVAAVLISAKLYAILTLGRCTSSKKLNGKTVLVTGANRGIGYYTAKDLAKRGARVIITSENKEDCDRARNQIIEETGNQNVISKYLDYTSLECTRAFAKDILDTEERLDVLVNNAGTVGLGSKLSKDGLLPGLQVNYFGPFLLTSLLTGLLRRSQPSRIVNVASTLSQCAILEPSDINCCPGPIFSDTLVYSNSKLLVVYATWEMADRLRGRVTVNCLHPGAVNTSIFQAKKGSWYGGLAKLLGPAFFKTAEEGAQTSIHLAVSEKVEGVTGLYFSDCKISKPYIKKNLAAIRNAWDQTVNLLKMSKEEIMS